MHIYFTNKKREQNAKYILRLRGHESVRTSDFDLNIIYFS